MNVLGLQAKAHFKMNLVEDHDDNFVPDLTDPEVMKFPDAALESVPFSTNPTTTYKSD